MLGWASPFDSHPHYPDADGFPNQDEDLTASGTRLGCKLSQMPHGAGIFTNINPRFMTQFCRSIFQHHGSHLALVTLVGDEITYLGN